MSKPVELVEVELYVGIDEDENVGVGTTIHGANEPLDQDKQQTYAKITVWMPKPVMLTASVTISADSPSTLHVEPASEIDEDEL